MSTPIEQVRDLKTSAKNQRDRGSKGYPRALTTLEEATAIANAELSTNPPAETRMSLAKELSDCYGLIGGVHRRCADESAGEKRATQLKASIRAYDEGHRYESDPQYGIADSYNLVNRLLVRLLLAPDALTSDAATVLDANIEPLRLAHELEQAAATVRWQLTGPRRGNYWALADLALLEVLLGRRTASTAYADFVGSSPPDFALTSAIAALKPLAELNIAPAPALGDAVNLLEERLKRLRA
jgi:hypothetical protein